MDATKLWVLFEPLPWLSCHGCFLWLSILYLFWCSGLFRCLVAWHRCAWLTDYTTHVVVCITLIIRLPFLLSLFIFFVYFTLSCCCPCLIKWRLWTIAFLNYLLFVLFQTYGVFGRSRIISNAWNTCFPCQAWILSKSWVTGHLLSWACWPWLVGFTYLAALVAREKVWANHLEKRCQFFA